jgi:hypothetical protein
MWTAILTLIGTLLTFLCKWGTEWLDGDKVKRQKREEVKHDIKNSTTQRERILNINRYNRI